MGKGKPRTKEQPWYYQGICQYFDVYTQDGISIPIHECFYPWRDKCMIGDIHKCMKIKLHWLASLSSDKRKSMLEKIENNTL